MEGQKITLMWRQVGLMFAFHVTGPTNQQATAILLENSLFHSSGQNVQVYNQTEVGRTE